MADLNRLLPTTWSRGNPVDIIGDASGKRYADALTTLIRDLEVDAILVLNCPTALAQAEEAARAIIDLAAAAERRRRSRPITLKGILAKIRGLAVVFLLYQKGRGSRILQAQDLAIDDYTWKGTKEHQY